VRSITAIIVRGDVLRGVVGRITEFAKSRTDDEWRAYTRQLLLQLRELIRENGEKAALLGFILGIFIVVFFKLFVVLIMLAIAAYSTILIIADSK
jgi:hypothetical protein